MKAYRAARFGLVYVWEGGRCRELPPRFDLRNHSPTGFAWGYAGSGPAQLALAILCDVYDDEKAVRLYQRFKFATIATLSQDAPLNLSLATVLASIEAIEKENADAEQSR